MLIAFYGPNEDHVHHEAGGVVFDYLNDVVARIKETVTAPDWSLLVAYELIPGPEILIDDIKNYGG